MHGGNTKVKKAQNRVRRRTLGQSVANSLRGKNSTVDSILGLHRAIMSHQTEVMADVPAQILREAFQIPEEGFGKALDISASNLGQIEKLSRSKSPLVGLNYLKLATDYVLHNPDRVNAWLELDAAASRETVAGNAENIKELLLALAPVDQQSLQSMKLYAALHSFSDDMIREYLNRNLPSHWTKNRLLYPLIYYVVHLPDNQALDHMIDHYFPTIGTGPAERILARFLLQPDDPAHANLALRCYVALISHPYDALEYIVTDLERRCAEGDTIEGDYLDQFVRLANTFPQHRVARLVSIARNEPLAFVDRPTDILGISLDSHPEVRETLLLALDARCREPPSPEAPTQLLTAVIGARWSRYPDPTHFDELSTFHRRFAMLTSGRLVRHLATSLFLFTRENAKLERLAVLLGPCCTGSWSPFGVSGPQGFLMARAGRMGSTIPPSEILARTSAQMGGDAEARIDRLWIKAANWALMEEQNNGRMRTWAAAARTKFPVLVQPRYLSGLDWNWLSDTISTLGMRSLIGNGDMVYVLFLRLLEEFRRESVPLRLAFEPIAKKHRSSEELSEWLHANFGVETSAFVRFFLTADTILKLRLTDNYMAAVSFRLELLVRAVESHSYRPGVFEVKDLEREQEVLTAMLCRMSVGARQFEIGWDMLADNAAERNHDAYSAYKTIAQAFSDDIAGVSRRTQPYQFSNGATGEYESLTRDWPLVVVIGGVIDTFLTHPSTGIEAILSVRIRHDAFRREYEAAIQQVEGGSVAGVPPAKTRQIVSRLSPVVYREIQRWIDAHMHTSRRDKPQALFHFVPSKVEMVELLQLSIGRELGDIVQIVFEWIRPRLNKQLTTVRASLVNELGPLLERRVQQTRREIDFDAREDSEVKRVTDAVVGSLIRRTADLEEWFKVPDSQRVESLRVDEVMNAVRQRFRVAHEKGALRWSDLPASVAPRMVGPVHIRLLYDLMSELIHNAKKHSRLARTIVRISRPGGADGPILLISNRKTGRDTQNSLIEGHQYERLNDALFGERKSGLQKIAHMAASIANVPTSVRVIERLSHFHLIIPIDAIGIPTSELRP